MAGLRVAIGGKGGVGKTTVCGVLAQLLAKSGLDVLAIDADPDTNLAAALGATPEQVPESIINMKAYTKSSLVFLSGESLPRCWTDPHYRDEELTR